MVSDEMVHAAREKMKPFVPPNNETLRAALEAALARGQEPVAWLAVSGTAGRSDGCDKPFWLRQDAIEYVQQHGGHVRPLFTAPTPPGRQAIARAISISYGEDPDEFAPLTRICGPKNEPLPCWMAYEEQAESVLCLYAAPPAPQEVSGSRLFKIGDRVSKKSGSSWNGTVCGFYSTNLTPVGYAVESEREPGSVHIYPEAALRSAIGGA